MSEREKKMKRRDHRVRQSREKQNRVRFSCVSFLEFPSRGVFWRLSCWLWWCQAMATTATASLWIKVGECWQDQQAKWLYSKHTKKRTEQNGHKMIFFLPLSLLLLTLLVSSIGCCFCWTPHIAQHKCAQEFKRRKWSCGTNVERQKNGEREREKKRKKSTHNATPNRIFFCRSK